MDLTKLTDEELGRENDARYEAMQEAEQAHAESRHQWYLTHLEVNRRIQAAEVESAVAARLAEMSGEVGK